MEDTPVSPVALVAIVVLLTIINCIIILQDFSSSFRCMLHVFPNFLLYMWKVSYFSGEKLGVERPVEAKRSTQNMNAGSSAASCTGKFLDDERVSIEEVKMMIEKLGSLSSPGGDSPEGRLGSKEMDVLFEEEPSLEEVKVAFHVFDENKDGFIEARELRKVLCTLGFIEASEAECREMIRAFDEDEDGRINFYEFVRLLEKSFS